jgi:ATP-binding cassette, subfamily B (MDR/TAP), member 1
VGGGLSIIYFVIYSSYGLGSLVFKNHNKTALFANVNSSEAFYFGSKLIIQGHADTGEVINVFMSIWVGAFSLAMLTPAMQSEPICFRHWKSRTNEYKR